MLMSHIIDIIDRYYHYSIESKNETHAHNVHDAMMCMICPQLSQHYSQTIPKLFQNYQSYSNTIPTLFENQISQILINLYSITIILHEYVLLRFWECCGIFFVTTYVTWVHKLHAILTRFVQRTQWRFIFRNFLWENNKSWFHMIHMIQMI